VGEPEGELGADFTFSCAAKSELKTRSPKNSGASESYLLGIVLWPVALATVGSIQSKSMN
jgi:hypothetical protein